MTKWLRLPRYGYKKRLVGETQSQSVRLLQGKWRLSCRRETQTLAVDETPQGPSVGHSWCDQKHLKCTDSPMAANQIELYGSRWKSFQDYKATLEVPTNF